jgi:hypothetical protein
MEICFVSEMGVVGKVPRNVTNMRTDLAWPCALEADCIPFNYTPNKTYDLAIVIIPKINIDKWIQGDVINKIKSYASKIAIMQEGPRWYFQDYPLAQQVWYYNSIRNADMIFCHNASDKKYYEGITSHPDVRVFPSLMIEDLITDLPKIDRKGVMLGGNFVSWYGGFDSFIIASETGEPIYSPRMGQRQEGEEQLGINQLPYLSWVDWIKELNKVKYGIHLMKTHAAGTFTLNCAYLGIPCIGYKGLDTQEICHPELTVELGDTLAARKLIRILKEDRDFYDGCSREAKANYIEHFHEDKFNSTWKEQFKIS